MSSKLLMARGTPAPFYELETHSPPPRPTPWALGTFRTLLATPEVDVALADVRAFFARANRWPNALAAIAEGEQFHLRRMREVHQETAVYTLLTYLGVEGAAEHLADIWLALLERLVDRSYRRADGTYAPAYRAQHDQVGLRRWLWWLPGDSPENERTDYHVLDRDLYLGHLGSALYAMHASGLGGKVARCVRELLTLVRNDLEPRSQYLADALHAGSWRRAGRTGEVAPWMFGHTLRHSTTARYLYYRCLHLVTGEARYLTYADELAEMLRAEWEWFDLPDGTRGLAHPHFVGPLRALKGASAGSLWHPVVYNEETNAYMLLDALIGGGLYTFQELGAVAALLAWTLPDQGWDAPTYPYSMGGGHPDGPYRCVRLHDGRRLPSRYGTISQANRGNSFQIQRGLVLAGAPWSGVAGLERVLAERERAAIASRGALKTVRLLYALKRAGGLP